MKIGSVIIVTAAALCGACSSTSGTLATHSRFAYPNSDIGLYDIDNPPLEKSVTVFFWNTPPLYDVRKELYDQAIARVKGWPLPRSIRSGVGPVRGNNVTPILINQKWVTTTTVYPGMPFATYTVRLEGTLAAMDVFDKTLE
ncbi:hypothetical protein [Phaeospirillum tilakii]|uniref:Uncharacterized protein n=1 Tax=Phaeospirillum tilakii TaxID=741673 RepID=A0ABW5CBD2_9PROT